MPVVLAGVDLGAAGKRCRGQYQVAGLGSLIECCRVPLHLWAEGVSQGLTVVVCCPQRSGLHVTLRLLGMRAEEASQHLLPALDPAAQALPRTSRQLSAWLAALQEASAATERAQAAHAEAARLQVCSVRGITQQAFG